MKRITLLASLTLLISAGAASADYVLIKVNVNQAEFSFRVPDCQDKWAARSAQRAPSAGNHSLRADSRSQADNPQEDSPGANFGFAGGGGVQPPPGGVTGGTPGAEPIPEDPNARWISAYVELKAKPRLVGKTPFGNVFDYEHKWSGGKKVWLPMSPIFQMVGAYVEQEPFNVTFNADLNKEKKTKDKNVEKYLILARKALSRGSVFFFHKAMKEAVDLDPKNAHVVNYLRVQKELQKPFRTQDPAQTELIDELKADSYKLYPSEQGHYGIYAQVFATDRFSEIAIRRRLAMMEDTLEVFYYWFAVQKGPSPQPAMPKHRLTAVLCNSKEEFAIRHAKWGSVSMVADGFTPRRDNVVVMSAKPRLNDPRYAEFESLLNNKLLDANTKLAPMKLTITRDDLLTGRVNEVKGAGNVGVFIAAAQTAVVLSKALEEEAERATITHEAVRQLLVSSEMFPRNVQIPDWMVEGLAAMFETPVGAVHPTVGAPSFTHLINFKHFRNTKKLDKASEAMFNVVTDRYFHEARQLSAESQDNRDSDTLRIRSGQAWELARSTSWSFVYYLVQNRKLDELFRYGKELDKLPRDMDLDSLILQSCFARAFAMTDPKDARRIERNRMTLMADSWFGMIQETNLGGQEMLPVQTFLMAKRAKQDADQGVASVTVGSPPATNPPMGVNPPIGVNPNPPPGVNPPPVVNPNPPPGVNPPPPGVNPPPPVVTPPPGVINPAPPAVIPPPVVNPPPPRAKSPG